MGCGPTEKQVLNSFDEKSTTQSNFSKDVDFLDFLSQVEEGFQEAKKTANMDDEALQRGGFKLDIAVKSDHVQAGGQYNSYNQ